MWSSKNSKRHLISTRKNFFFTLFLSIQDKVQPLFRLSHTSKLSQSHMLALDFDKENQDDEMDGFSKNPITYGAYK